MIFCIRSLPQYFRGPHPSGPWWRAPAVPQWHAPSPPVSSSRQALSVPQDRQASSVPLRRFCSVPFWSASAPPVAGTAQLPVMPRTDYQRLLPIKAVWWIWIRIDLAVLDSGNAENRNINLMRLSEQFLESVFKEPSKNFILIFLLN
jgi:hypothetical protein